MAILRASKQLGQNFTPEYVAKFMVGLAQSDKKAKVLEPGCGEGVFLEALQAAGYSDVLGIEVDPSLKIEVRVQVRRESFVSAEIKDRFSLVIGNPPYVRWKNMSSEQQAELKASELWQRYCNSLCDLLNIFILKGIELLEEGGEMIFVTPEYWLNTQHAQGTRDYMARRGYFSDIFHFNETPIFAHVTSSIAIWRYVKSSAVKPRMRVVKYNAKKRLSAADLERLGRREAGLTTEVFERRAWEVGRKWLLVSEATEEELVSYEAVCTPRGQQNYMSLGEIADIGNGMVSGLDQAFAIPSETKLSAIEQAASIKVLKAKQIRQFKHGALTRYIYLGGTGMDETKLRHDYPTFYDQLQKYRDALAKRYSYGRKLPYWEWAFARSYALFSRRVDRIFVPGKERISHKDYFRFSYVEAGVYPTQDVTGVFLKPGVKEDLRYVLAVLNSPQVFDWLKCNGVVKGNLVEFSERPLASIPIRMIDWEDATEMTEHNAIVAMVTDYLENREASVMAALIQRVGDFLTRARS